jgi:hypothetical protein
MSDWTCDNISRCTFRCWSSPTWLKNPTVALWWLGRDSNFLTSQRYPALPNPRLSWTALNLIVEYRLGQKNCPLYHQNLSCLSRLPLLQISPSNIESQLQTRTLTVYTLSIVTSFRRDWDSKWGCVCGQDVVTVQSKIMTTYTLF